MFGRGGMHGKGSCVQETRPLKGGGMHPTKMHSCYQPQRSCGQGYVSTCVCDSVKGVGLPQCML